MQVLANCYLYERVDNLGIAGQYKDVLRLFRHKKIYSILPYAIVFLQAQAGVGLRFGAGGAAGAFAVA